MFIDINTLICIVFIIFHMDFRSNQSFKKASLSRLFYYSIPSKRTSAVPAAARQITNKSGAFFQTKKSAKPTPNIRAKPAKCWPSKM